MARDECGRIENSKRQLETMSDDRLKEILKCDRHGHNNQRWAREILTDRRLERLEVNFAAPWCIAEIDAEDKANAQHDAVVAEIEERMAAGEFDNANN